MDLHLAAPGPLLPGADDILEAMMKSPKWWADQSATWSEALQDYHAWLPDVEIAVKLAVLDALAAASFAVGQALAKQEAEKAAKAIKVLAEAFKGAA